MCKKQILCIVALFFVESIAWAQPLPANPGRLDPGVQLKRDQELFREVLQERDLQQERDTTGINVDRTDGKKQDEHSRQELFELKDVTFSASSVLSEQELNDIVSAYKGRGVSAQDIQDILDAINDLYAQKGYIVCRAFLKGLTPETGSIEILLVEGRTGSVFIEGAKITRDGYIRKRLPLSSGEIANLNQLNEALVRFNGTNPTQLTVEIKAGSEPETSDYYIWAEEPQKHIFSIFADNSGSETTGKVRGGVAYTNRSLLGYLDELNLTIMGSEGSAAGAFSYRVPVNTWGTRLGLNYSQNTTKIKNGELKTLDIEGGAKNYGVSLSHPFIVSDKTQLEGSVEWSRQESHTDILSFDWIDDTIDNYTAGLSWTYYFSQSILYQRHSLTHSKWTDINDVKTDNNRYNLMMIYQRGFKNRHQLELKGYFQQAFDDYLPSSNQFYIGGFYSVRGYKESFLGADSGVSFSLQYSVPVKTWGSAFGFVDYGKVYGENAFDDDQLASVGTGFQWNFMQNGSVMCAVGFPLIKEINNETVSSARFHFSLTKQF